MTVGTTEVFTSLVVNELRVLVPRVRVPGVLVVLRDSCKPVFFGKLSLIINNKLFDCIKLYNLMYN